MNQKKESDSSNIQHRELSYHLKKMPIVIERFENNHFKWYMAQITILGLTISFSTLALNSLTNVAEHFKIFLFIAIAFIAIILSFVAFHNSRRYLKFARGLRKQEPQLLKDGKLPTYNSKGMPQDKSRGFTFYTSVTFLATTWIIPIVIVILYFI